VQIKCGNILGRGLFKGHTALTLVLVSIAAWGLIGFRYGTAGDFQAFIGCTFIAPAGRFIICGAISWLRARRLTGIILLVVALVVFIFFLLSGFIEFRTESAS